MDYRASQKRNTQAFNARSKAEKKAIRKWGYNNRGWENVKNSWTLLTQFVECLGRDISPALDGVKQIFTENDRRTEGLSAYQKLEAQLVLGDKLTEYIRTLASR